MTFTEVLIMVSQFLLSLSLLIILHEWGHYYPAKLFGTRVEKFYLFFDAWGKKLVSFNYKGTEYGIGWLPLGGYVKISGMIDESMDTEQMKEEPKEWEFRSKPAWQRLVIMLGGVTVNFVLAYLIFVAIAFTWGDKFLANDEVKDGIVVAEFIEQQIGLKSGDKIVSIDGETPVRFNDVRANLLFGSEIVVNRNNELKTLQIPEGFLGDLVDSDVKGIIDYPRPLVIGKIPESSHNKSIGLKKKDIIIAVNGEKVSYAHHKDVFKKYSSKEVILTLMNHKKEQREVKAFISDKGMLGINPTSLSPDDLEKLGYYKFSVKKYSFGESFTAGGVMFIGKFKMMLKNLKAIGNPKTGAYKGVGSFVSIAKIFPTTWDWHFFWNITAFLSIMLGVLNLLPIPALDGGHAVFVLYEMITGRKPGDKFLEYAQMAGFVIMMTLFVYAFGNDIYRHFIK
ncbi:MAG: RIP metalloprotease RseP [Flavobacteriaceae bacterium]|nr:RIP metalloprotease RseP [Flavobacteriaceae bacterium]